MRRRWPLLVLILAPLIGLWPGLAGLALGPFDAIRQMAPWNGPKPAQPWDVLMADSVLQSHVWRTLVLDAWGKGQLPLWNPYEFAGTPLLANSQSGGFYPPHIVLGLLHVPAGFAGFLLAWFHLALAGLGTYALVRRLGGSPAGGLTGGLAFVLSPFLLGWAPLSSVPSTVAWIPLALACVVDVENRRSWAALAACVGMMLLAGHLQFAAYGLGVVLLFGLASSFLLPPQGSPLLLPTRREAPADAEPDREREDEGPGVAVQNTAVRQRGRSLPAVLLALLLGAALAAPQLLPVLAYSKESHRRNVPTEEGYQAYVGSALRPFELASLGHPTALGNPREPFEVGGQTISTYWPALARPGANFAESAVGIGAVVLALLFAVPWRRRETWPLAAMGGLALLLALGTPLNRLLYFLVPGWSSTGSPARVEVLFVLAACALAGLAVDTVAERRKQILAAVGAVVGMLLAVVLPSLVLAEGTVAAVRGAATAGAILPVVAATIVTVLGLFGAKRTAWAVPAAVVAVACLTHALTLVPFGKPLDPPKGDPDVRIAVVNEHWNLFSTPNALLPPNLAALGGLHELSGYDSLTSRDAVAMLRQVNGGNDPSPPENGNLMFVKPNADPQELANWGVTEVWSQKELPEFGTPGARDGYRVYRLQPLPGSKGWVTGGKVEEGYDRIQVKAEPGGSIRVMDRLGAGWTMAQSPPSATFRRDRTIGWSIVEPPSKSTGFNAMLIYRPPGLVFGEDVGAAAWLTLLSFSAFSWRASKRTRSV